MRTKLLFILLAFLVPVHSFAKKLNKQSHQKLKIITRLPLDFDFTVEDVNNTLQIVFIGGLPDADLLVTDKTGNIVWEEYGVQLYDGKMVYIPDADGYPYRIEIVSPVMDVTGEITLDEN